MLELLGKDRLTGILKDWLELISEGELEMVNEEEDGEEVGEDDGAGVEVGEGVGVEVPLVEPFVGVMKIIHPPVPSGFLPADCPDDGVVILLGYVISSIEVAGDAFKTNFIVSPPLLRELYQSMVQKLPLQLELARSFLLFAASIS